MNRRLAQAKRVVIKIGSALLVEPNSGHVRQRWLDGLIEDIAAAHTAGQDVIIVSSGAIGLGRRRLGIAPGRLRLEESQAAAATGQIRLAHAYQQSLARHDITAAQVLLTIADTEERRRYLNARSTVTQLLKLGAVPVINENDTVATSEIRFGDNDRLAARVAQMLNADLLIVLSDVDGLYTANPEQNPQAEFLAEVAEITPEVERMAGASQSDYGTGGMVTKIQAAKIALGAGCNMVITSGHVERPLTALKEGGRCTWFTAKANPATARKQWIAGMLEPSGAFVVDGGAAAALGRGRSLLPAGVTGVEGEFRRGDAVSIRDAQGHELARGLSAYSADDARRIIGHKSDEIETLLGYRGRDEIIHRDDLVLTG